VNLGEITIGRGVFEPGWSWEKCIKPIVKTNSCQAPHTMYVISKRMHVVMDDGTESETGPGDCVIIPQVITLGSLEISLAFQLTLREQKVTQGRSE
jgi:hypothetical protein